MAISDADISTSTPHPPELCATCQNAPWYQKGGDCPDCGLTTPVYHPQPSESLLDQRMVCPLTSTRFHTPNAECPVCLGNGVIPLDMGESLIGFLVAHLSESAAYFLASCEISGVTHPIGDTLSSAMGVSPAGVINESGDTFRIYIEPATFRHGVTSAERFDVWTQDKSRPIGQFGRIRMLHGAKPTDVLRYLAHVSPHLADQWRPRPF